MPRWEVSLERVVASRDLINKAGWRQKDKKPVRGSGIHKLNFSRDLVHH